MRWLKEIVSAFKSAVRLVAEQVGYWFMTLCFGMAFGMELNTQSIIMAVFPALLAFLAVRSEVHWVSAEEDDDESV